jgi:glutathione reductase (NADPH)
VDAHTVEVAGRRYTARNILVATGGWPYEPEVHGIEHVITSNEALDLPRLPRRLAVVGGGYVGVEFASIFHALGSEVTMLVRSDGLLRGFDRDIRAALREEMETRGITILSETRVHSVERDGDRVSLRLAHEEILEADTILCATGRKPNTRDIGLESCGVEMDEDGSIVVDEWSRSSVPSIYAIGDVTNRANLTPVAIADGRALAETLFNDTPSPSKHDQIPTAVFSIPPVGTVGLTEEQARHHHAHVDVYRVSFRPMKHTLSGRPERTMMKLIVERESDLVLGCHMVGEDAPEIVQGLAIALRAGATKRQFDATLGIHPTAAEEFVTMREPLSEDG